MDFKSVRIEGRTGPKRSDCGAVIDYDPNTKHYIIRVDDANNLEFWVRLIIPEDALEVSKKQAEEDGE